MRRSQILALTPPRACDVGLAIAASRAGALGVLDLEYATEFSAARALAKRLARYAQGAYGLKVSCHQAELLDALLADAAVDLRTVILTGSDGAALRARIAALQGRCQVLLEARSLDDGRLGLELGVDGLVAKGNEAGGSVAEETSFVLVQALLGQLALPVYVQGGIGLHTAAACHAAGAAGAVLDSQLLLTPEAGLPRLLRERIAVLDGSETLCVGAACGQRFRLAGGPLFAGASVLQQEEARLSMLDAPETERSAAWEATLGQMIGWDNPARQIVPLGQDAALAAPLAQRYHNVAGIIAAIEAAAAQHCEQAARLLPLAEGAPLARSHGTRYPLVQGPMTRVSDQAAFAAAVAREGGLPFLALALMPHDEAKALLAATGQALGDAPWGVGILGFVPGQIRQAQLEAIRAARPPFALIAGGRPDQARDLEQQQIATYLHVPSPELLRQFLAEGARRFVFEGRECGGHVGPRTSFVLWEQMIDVLLDYLATAKDQAQSVHVLFAGGIHDERSSAMVAALAAPLAERGVRVGGLMGTAYLFTAEAVASRAIVAGYQEQALQARTTVLLESGPGHVTRCLPGAFAAHFQAERRRLQAAGAGVEELRDALETLNLGRLRIASKGLAHNPRYGQEPAAPHLLSLDAAAQQDQGMYMVGQVVALRDTVCTIAELHHAVSAGGSALLARLARQPEVSPAAAPHPAQIAIVGMACRLPGAADLQRYWENILAKVDAVTEVPRERWDWQRYFDPDQAVRDKIYSRWGGFIDEVPFNPLDYGMPPNSVYSIEPLQLLMLDVVRAALADAGYLERPFARERTAVIVAVGGGLGDLGYLYGFRSYLPHFLDPQSEPVIARLNERLPEWTEDSFPGILLNVAAGRIANRFDLGGPNLTVDAACASSLAALNVAVDDLEAGRTDMAIVGAGDTVQSPFAFLAFSKTQALSPTGRCRPFDAAADGIAISEGLAVVVLKRLADAERDGDRVYAVINGIAGSSDGKDRGLTAPRPVGQRRALERAFARAGVSPAQVGLVEAHGTGTRVGDLVEVEALRDFFEAGCARRQACALGSVKSMIGHTKSTAGMAGLIKVALSLYHKVLPPTLVETPNPRIDFAASPFYVAAETRPWLSAREGDVRRAGVSAFGFGGTNFHALLEEHRDAFLPPQASQQTWAAELLVCAAPERDGLLSALAGLERWLADGNEPRLHALAATLYHRYRRLCPPDAACHAPLATVALVASSIADARQKLSDARAKIAAGIPAIADPRGVFYAAQPLAATGRLALLFPGQGSQYPGMLSELALQFPQVRACFEQANLVLDGQLERPLSDYIFPLPTFDEQAAAAARQALTATQVAQPALGAAGMAAGTLLAALGLRPDFVSGHSYGEIVALWAAGVLDAQAMLRVSDARGRFMAEAAGPEAGTMAAVKADAATVSALLGPDTTLTLANLNSPLQTVISGPTSDVERAVERFLQQQIWAQRLPVACAFHSPLVDAARDRLAAYLETLSFSPPRCTVFANTTGSAYPDEPAAIRALLSRHLSSPVLFQQQIEALYAEGARVFVEAGPGSVLSGLVAQTLGERTHLAIAIDRQGAPALPTLLRALAQLLAAGFALSLDPLFEGREAHDLDLARPYAPTGTALSPTTYLLSGGGVRLPQQAPSTPQPLAVRLAESPPAPQSALVAPTAPDPSEPPADEVGQVMLRYQQLMDSFLQTQQAVMSAYLATPPVLSSAIASPTRSSSPVPPAASATAAQPQVAKHARAGHEDDAVDGADRTVLNGGPLLLDQAALLDQLSELVSERTGYPPAMLDPTLDLEADLGIDSIKRVEILGALRRKHPSLDEVFASGVDELQQQRSLQAIAAWIAERGAQPPPLADAEEARSMLVALPTERGAAADEDARPILRYTLAPLETPLDSPQLPLDRERAILITDDGCGVAALVQQMLEARGYRVAMLSPEAFAEQAALTAALAEVRRQGPIGSLLHLAPLRGDAPSDLLDVEGWRRCLRRDLSGLFRLIQALHAELTAAGSGGCLLAATAMGGLFASGPADADAFFAGHGGIAGLLKTAAHELPTLRVKALDLRADSAPPEAAQAIVQECGAADGLVEIGYHGTTRRTLAVVPTELPRRSASAAPPLDEHSLLLVTGGARGITALASQSLARQYRPRLVLVGRAALPSEQEAPATASLSGARALKEALLADARRAGQAPALPAIEAAYQKLLREREMRSTLAAIRAAGASVDYYQADVRDEAAFGALIDTIYQEHGRIDGVIHGAGVIEDRLLKDKTADSFARVLETKVAGALTLARKLRPETLRFLIFFSSVSARFGNRGQGDYAAANEVLNKLACQLDRRWPARVASLAWGPWDSPGMVSDALRGEFARRGVGLIPVDEGLRRLAEEIADGQKGDAELLICGADTQVMAWT
jgi:acyl transferase domain-containing protein/NAD(P)H-dependent flavin oxidoreductase YrpB (nitropropane dioxygenase family)